MKTPLLVDILCFIKKWLSALNRIKPPKKTSIDQNQLLNTKFHIPSDIPIDINEQLTYIIRNILLPITDRSIPIKKIYHCSSCKLTIDVILNVDIIEISMVDNQFYLHHQLANYFASGTSDHLCDKCNMYMSRQIKILDCKNIYNFVLFD